MTSKRTQNHSNVGKQNNANVVLSQQSWSGPLPPPAALQQFNEVIPNGAERIVAMVEAEQQHRMKLENEILSRESADIKRSHWFGALIALFAIMACVFSVWLGAHYIVSVSLVGLPIAAIVQAVIKR